VILLLFFLQHAFLSFWWKKQCVVRMTRERKSESNRFSRFIETKVLGGKENRDVRGNTAAGKNR